MLKRICKTPGAIYEIGINHGFMISSIYCIIKIPDFVRSKLMNKDIQEIAELENKMHDAIESVLSSLWSKEE